MKVLVIALLAFGLASPAFAADKQPAGAKNAQQVSKNTLKAVHIGMAVTAAAVIAGATSNSNHGNENNGGGGTAPGGTTGSTGTTGTTGTN